MSPVPKLSLKPSFADFFFKAGYDYTLLTELIDRFITRFGNELTLFDRS